ncbi:acyl carrier protein [Streptomyces sp. NPDC048636]|uniref:acyl carrier protein n=1 Tax=Streptomyces sp. NPDC048636 TaxID=3155762 RepID=UPI00341EBEE9
MDTNTQGHTTTGTTSAVDKDVQKDILRFLHTRTKRTWKPETDLFASGGQSSLFAMELVVHLEKSFGVAIRGKDLRLDNFRTVVSMTELVHRLQAGAGGTGD